MASATQMLTDMLNGAGLGSLADMVWDLHRQGFDEDYIYNEIVQSEVYRTRFSGLVKLREDGAAAGMSEIDYLQVERAMSDILVSQGLGDTQFNTVEYLGQVIGAQNSVDEFQTRVELGVAASSTLPEDIRAEFRDMYGIGQENILAYYLDTENVARDLQQQQRAAAISAAYNRFQSPAISRDTFEELAARGVEYGDAVRAFAGLGTLGRGLGELARLEGAFGMTQGLERERAGRKAAYAGGGTAAQTREGLTGLSAASS